MHDNQHACIWSATTRPAAIPPAATHRHSDLSLSLRLLCLFHVCADYADTLALVCDSFKRASNAGIIVAAAAGNYGEDIRGEWCHAESLHRTRCSCACCTCALGMPQFRS